MISKVIETSLRNRWLVVWLYILIAGWGILSIQSTPIDAIPNIGENQIIVYADWPGNSPRDVEDQVTYPLTISLMGLPKVKTVRSNSYFGFSIVNVIFEDGVEFYWARTRVLERMSVVQTGLPQGVIAQIGPDATALGQIYWYTIENGWYCPDHSQHPYDEPGTCPIDGKELVRSVNDLGELRSIQDWYVRYQLSAIEGVAEVASVGGYVKQYQIEVDPNKLVGYGISITALIEAVKKSNIDVGAKVFEENGTELVVRGVGLIKTVEDIENIVVAAHNGVPVFVKNVAHVAIGPDFRRGVLDKGGREVTGGVVHMRYGENPLEVTERIEQKISELSAGLPPGVRIIPFYERTGLISRSIDTLTQALIMAIVITIIIIVLFLLHFWASFVISLVLPVGVLISFIIMRRIGVDANIMSLGGIIIAIGVMVDAGIVMTENIYRHLADEQRKSDKLTKKERFEIVASAAKEVGPPVLFSLLTTIVSFIPVFALSGKSGRLFHPLAYTKTFAMAGAALLALTLLPTLGYFFLRGKLRPIDKNKISVILKRIYEPVLKWNLRYKFVAIVMAVILLVTGVIIYPNIKSEFMPPLNEGDLLFMPVLLPGASLTQVLEVMQKQDVIIKNSFPDEVEMVVGKLGRVESALDPAPVTMIESIIRLKPKKYWRKGMTREKLIEEIKEATKIIGVSPIMTQPIQNRIDMLATGIQTPVGVKVFGDDLNKIVEIAIRIEKILTEVPGAIGPYAERANSRPYFEIKIDRVKAARYGVKIGDVQNIIMTAIGGMNISTKIEGRERYPISVRYPSELRDTPEAIQRILIPTPTGAQVPLAQLASLQRTIGPAMIGSENGLTYGRVFVSVEPKVVSLVEFVENAQKVVKEKIIDEGILPPGYYITWSGQYESEIEANKRLRIALPVALSIIFILLYIAFRSFPSLVVVATGIPVSLMGGVILLYIMGYNMSVAVWVGFIALFGVATDNAVVLVSTIGEIVSKKKLSSKSEIRDAIIQGSILRVRPIIMTTATTVLALLPVLMLSGTGSEIMKPMVVPTIGGLFTATLSNLFLVPALYGWIKERSIT